MFLLSEVVPWFENGGLVGGLLGGAIGIVGGGLGTAIGICAPRGVGRNVIIPLCVIILVACAGLLATAVVALASGQPYAVWYPLALPGFIGTVVLGSLFPMVVMRYRQAEGRHLEAEEFRQS